MKTHFLKTVTVSGFPSTEGVEGEAYGSWTPIASGGIQPCTFACTGLPSGITCNATTGLVSGIPAGGSVGIYNCSLTATDKRGRASMPLLFSIDISSSATTPGPAIADQTIDFGALTLANAGRFNLNNINTGTPITSASITGGTRGAGWVIVDSFYIVRTQAMNADQDGLTIEVLVGNEFNTDTAILTLNSIANTYHFSSAAEIAALLTAGMKTTVDGKTMEARPGTQLATLDIDSKTWAATTTIQGPPTAWPPTASIESSSAAWILRIRQSHNARVKRWKLKNTNTAIPAGTPNSNGQVINMTGTLVCNGCIIEENEICGVTFDELNGQFNFGATPQPPLAGTGNTFALKASGALSRPAAIRIQQPVKNLTIKNNWIHHVWSMGSIGSHGVCEFSGNRVQACYYDGVPISYPPPFNGNSSTATIIRSNVIGDLGGRGDDWMLDPSAGTYCQGSSCYSNIHADLTQWSLRTDADWEGLVIESNIIFLGNSRCGSSHGIFADVAGGAFFIDTPRIAGNVVISYNGGGHGLSLPEVKDARIYNNTILNHLNGVDPFLSDQNISIGNTRSSGIHIAIGNICGALTLGGTPTLARNVEAGGTDYTGVLAGGNYNRPLSVSEVLSRFGTFGGPSAGAAGAVNSGYQTWPTNIANWGATECPNQTGHSIDTSYEVP